MINEAGDCLDYPLLHDGDRADWPLWLKAHGVADDARAQRGSAFEDDFLLIRAAEAGQGLALVPQAQVDDYVIVHVGYALGLIDPEEAQRTLAMFEELDRLQPEAL